MKVNKQSIPVSCETHIDHIQVPRCELSYPIGSLEYCQPFLVLLEGRNRPLYVSCDYVGMQGGMGQEGGKEGEGRGGGGQGGEGRMRGEGRRRGREAEKAEIRIHTQ